jgi:hypothetical protein
VTVPGPVNVLLTHAGLNLPMPSPRPAPVATPNADKPRRSVLTPDSGFPSPVQRILVRHGRLFLGPAGLLHNPHADRLEYLATEQWIDIPNGLFRLALLELEGEQLGAWLRAFSEQRSLPPAALLGEHGEQPPRVHVAILEAVELTDAIPEPG